MVPGPYVLAFVLVLAACAGFLIGFHAAPEPEIALNWSVPSGPEAYPAFIR